MSYGKSSATPEAAEIEKEIDGPGGIRLVGVWFLSGATLLDKKLVRQAWARDSQRY
jgi:hypothetical protein